MALKWHKLADQLLGNEALTKEQALSILQAKDEEIF